jgi:uncharacterized membrane protein YkgB
MKTTNAGYSIGLIAITLALVWIGLFKFTDMEAMGIKHYVQNSFLLSWMYKLFSIGTVSMIIGSIEIITGILLFASFWFPQAGRIGGVMAILIFLTTLSFLLTTPMTWKLVEGVPMTDFFVLKDLAFLAIAVQIFERSKTLST